MATTTVKISSRASRKLDTLAARQSLQTKKRVTKQSVLEDLIDCALEEDEPLILLRAPKYPLTRRVLRMLETYPMDWGVETREEEIDKILYGAGT